MAVTLTIGGLDRTAYVDITSIDASLPGANVAGECSFVVDDPTRAVTLATRAGVLILDGATRLWGGLIASYRAEVVAGGMRRYRVTARDYGILLDDSASIEQTFAAGTTERAVVQAIVAGSGLSAPNTTVVVTSTLSSALTISAKSRRAAIEQLMQAVGGTRYLWVDELAQVHYRSSSLGAAPWVLVDGAPTAGQADYESLSLDRDAALDATEVTRGTVTVVGADGWKPGQTVTISSTALGLSSAQYFLAEVGLRFETDAVRRWTLSLGAPARSLASTLASAPALPPPVITSIAQFAASIRPPVVVSSLPTLPNGQWPAGSLVYLTTDGKLYKTETGSAWEAVVTAVDLDGQITTTQIADNAISTPKLQANAVTTGKLAAGAVTANEIAANSVVAGKVAAAAIGTNELAAGAVTADKIAALAVQAQHLKVGGVETGNLLINGSFERAQGFDTETTAADDIYGWASAGAGQLMAATSGYARTGTHVLRVRAGGVANPAAYQIVPILPGRRYRLRAWVARNTSDGGAISSDAAFLIAHTLDRNGQFVQFNRIAVNCGASSTLTEYAGEYVTPSDGSVTSLRIELRIGGTPATNQVAIFEDVVLELVPDTVRNASAEVVIDSAGLTIQNGKLTFLDQYGATALDGTGFGPSWQDLVNGGLYNGNFDRYSGSGMPAGWTTVAGTFPLTVVTGTGWGSGNAIQYAPTAASTVDTTLTSDLVAITGRAFLRLATYWISVTGTGTINVQLSLRWYDRTKAFISETVVAAFQAPPDSWFVEGQALGPPSAARYVQAKVDFRCVSGSATARLGAVALYQATTTADLIPSGVIVAWNGTTADRPPGWAVCDGTNGTPDLTDRFIVGGTTTASGGSVSPTAALPTHSDHGTHASGGSHTHGTTGSVHDHTTGSPSSAVQASSGTAVIAGSSTHLHSITGTGSHQHASDGGHTHDAHSSHSAHSVYKYYRLIFLQKL